MAQPNLHREYHHLHVQTLRDMAHTQNRAVRSMGLDDLSAHVHDSRAYATRTAQRVRAGAASRDARVQESLGEAYTEEVERTASFYGNEAQRPEFAQLSVGTTVQNAIESINTAEESALAQQAVLYMAVLESAQAYRNESTNDTAALQLALNRSVTPGALILGKGNIPLSGYAATVYNDTERYLRVSADIETALVNGEDLMEIVSVVGEAACDVCAEWQGMIVSVSGTNEDYPSVADAEAAGVWHHNCNHTLEPVDPEDLPEAPTDEEKQALEEEGDWLEEQQRLESGIEYWERREAVALDRAEEAFARMHKDKWETSLTYTQRHKDEWRAGRARDKGEALVTLQSMGVADIEQSGDLIDLSLPQLNTMTRDLVEHQEHWTFDRRIDEVHGVDEIHGSAFGIEFDNAATGTIGEGDNQRTMLIIGPGVESTMTDLIAPGNEEKAEEMGLHATAEQIRDIRESRESGHYDNHDMFVAYSYPDIFDGVVSHELGHAVDQMNPEVFQEIAAKHGGEEQAAKELGISERGRQGWGEAIAESYAWYVRGNTSDIDPDLLAAFRELTDYGY